MTERQSLELKEDKPNLRTVSKPKERGTQNVSDGPRIVPYLIARKSLRAVSHLTTLGHMYTLTTIMNDFAPGSERQHRKKRRGVLASWAIALAFRCFSPLPHYRYLMKLSTIIAGLALRRETGGRGSRTVCPQVLPSLSPIPHIIV